MIKKEFIKEVASSTGVDEATTRIVFNGIQQTMQNKLIEGVDLKLKGFMNLTLEIQKERKLISFKTKELVIVPARFKVKITLPRLFKKRIAQKTVWAGNDEK